MQLTNRFRTILPNVPATAAEYKKFAEQYMLAVDLTKQYAGNPEISTEAYNAQMARIFGKYASLLRRKPGE